MFCRVRNEGLYCWERKLPSPLVAFTFKPGRAQDFKGETSNILKTPFQPIFLCFMALENVCKWTQDT